MNRPGVSVILVTWNAEPFIEECLRSLLDFAPDRPFEILVLDNASRDGTRGRVRSFAGPVQLVELSDNLGFAAACNEGYRRSGGDYLLFLNPDLRSHPGAVESLCSFLDLRPEASAAAGKLVDREGLPQRGFNVRRFPTLASTAFEILMLDKLFPRNPITRSQRMLDFSFNEECEVEQPAGACLLVRRSAFERVGLFDPDFHPAWFEDVDLCLRLRRSGHRIFFVPGAVFLHYGGASLESLDYGEFLAIWYRNLLRFFRKHHGGLAAAVLRGLIAAGMVERMMVTLFASPRSGVTRPDARAAYWQVVKETL